MSYVLEKAQAEEILRRYDIRVAEKPTEPGTDLVLEGYQDERYGQVLALHGGSHTSGRPLPITESGAASMLDAFSSERSVAHDHKSRAMLAHLILKAAHMFEEMGIERFDLIVRIRDNGYLVRHATMWARAEPQLTHRLAPHAHDYPPRSYGYRPERAKRSFSK